VPATPAQRVYDIDIPAQAAYVENRWDRINKACDDIPSKVLGDHCWDEEDSLIGRPAWRRKPYPNVWLGVSVEDQKRADERIPHLLRTPAAVRFLSVEPLLGPIDLTMLGGGMFADSWMDCLRGTRGTRSSWADMRDRRIDWVIVGGESGPGARPMHPQWARDIRDQCQSAGVAFHFKQWGGWMPLPEPFRYSPAIGSGNREYNVALRRFAKSYGASVLIDDRPEGWDRAMIEDGCAITNGEMAIGRVGKKASGRLLDGRTWDEFPQPLTPAPA
jgi:protein gp37